MIPCYDYFELGRGSLEKVEDVFVLRLIADFGKIAAAVSMILLAQLLVHNMAHGAGSNWARCMSGNLYMVEF